MSRERQKSPLPYPSVLRKMTSRVNHLRDELALESVTNIEFEHSSRRSIEFLIGQVKTLKEAFNTLTETLLQELDKHSSIVRGEQRRLDERHGDFEKRVTLFNGEFEKRVIREISDTVQRQHEQHQQGHQEVQRHCREGQLELQKLHEKQQERQHELSRQQERQQEQHHEFQKNHERQQVEIQKHYEKQQERQLELQKNYERQQLEVQKQYDRQQERQQELHKDYERSQERHLQGERRADLVARDLDTLQEKQQQLETRQLDLERRVDPIARDVDTMLGVVPNIEDTMHKAHSHFQERIGAVTHDISKINDAATLDWGKVSNLVERLEVKVKSLEGDLREKLEQQNFNFQRSITRQLESMSRVLLETERQTAIGPNCAGQPLLPVEPLRGGSGSASGVGACGGAEASLLRAGGSAETSLLGVPALGHRHVDFNFSGLEPLSRHGAGSFHGSIGSRLA